MGKATGAGSAKTESEAEFLLDRDGIVDQYNNNLSIYEALREEIVFILEDRISTNSIKIHAIESRVKQLPSLIDKCIRKEIGDPFEDLVDIAAARVICLFRSDIDEIKRIVDENFEIISVDDKISTGNDPLGYLSIHLICKIKTGFSGPRYEKIIDKAFEIQLRTLCMHCWATVSHYVDYKGDWDVPANLKMALSALGGLFFVADSEFEQFNTAMTASKKSAEKTSLSEAADTEINLDTITALLRRIFPKRASAPAEKISEFVQEIKKSGYASLKDVQMDIEKGKASITEFEKRNHKGRIFFTEIGAGRHALSAVSSAFENVRTEEFRKFRERRKAIANS